MASADHSDYRIEILCPDLSSELRLERGTAQERLGMPFEISLSLYSEDKAIDMTALLGKPMAVHVSSANDERYFHGIVAHFSQVGFSSRHGHYHVVLRPKLWLLGQSACCKVFRSMSVQDILKKTLQDGSVDFGAVMSSPSVQFEHCVQYRETDLHFASRMMERYGLYYFHKHQKGKHVLEIASGLSGHSDVGTFEHSSAGTADGEHQILCWRATTSLRSSSYRVSGTKNLTRQPIEAKEKSRFSIAAAPNLEIDDFEAVDEYEKPWLEELAKARMQAIDATVEEFTGQSCSPKLAVGALFTLDGHPRAEQNRQYLIFAATYQFDGHLPDGEPASDHPYVVTFAAIDGKTPFSPPVLTKKPVVQGPHLATVVEETDEFGRVLVKFHWGNPDGDIESCRARVSQNWAGKEWGGVFLPHIDHEVIVEFLDGDPDQPIVTGRVYNEESMPPLSLPGDKQKCIIRDHGGNEIVMDGTGGSQTIRIYCPSHESVITLGKSIELLSDSNWVNKFLGELSTDITGDKKEAIGGNQKVTTTGNKEETVTGNEKTTTAGNKDEQVVGKASVKVGADMFEAFCGVKSGMFVGAEFSSKMATSFEAVKGVKASVGSAKDLRKAPDALVEVKNHVHKGERFSVAAPNRMELNSDNWIANAKKYTVNQCDEAQFNAKKTTVKGDNVYHKLGDTFHVKAGTAQVDAKLKVNGKTVFNDGALEVS